MPSVAASFHPASETQLNQRWVSTYGRLSRGISASAELIGLSKDSHSRTITISDRVQISECADMHLLST